jgi:hypothetical protein
MATSPNFSWPEPDNSDLVKNGALAIRTAVDAIDSSMADLKGGTTGQVLTKASGTDMDFSWGTASSGSSYVAGKNGLINSAFDVWQRSTSATFAGTLSWVAADRWFGVALGSSPTCTMSRQTADNTFLTYGMRFGRNSGQTATGDVYVGNTLESIDARRFAGQTVTLSFYVKSGANAPTSFVSQIRTGTGTDQSSATLFSTGWTGGLNNSQTNTVSTTMTRYTQTVTLGSTVNQIMVLFSYTPTGTAGANEWFQIEGVQLEIAAAASAFSRNAGTIQGELAACQRYYFRGNANASGNYVTFGLGMARTTSDIEAVINFPVAMRVAPTSIDYSTLAVFDAVTVTALNAAPTFPSGGVSTTAARVYGPTAGGLTLYRPYQLIGNGSTSAYIGFSAEL